MSDRSSEPAWVVDPSIRWRILLSASVPGLSDEAVSTRLRALHRVQRWPEPAPVRTGALIDLRRDLAEVVDVPLAVGRAGHHLVISAHHSHVDGLGLLDVLAALTGTSVASATRGVEGRRSDGTLVGGLLRRLREVVLTPPARIAGTVGRTGADGDTFVSGTLSGRLTTARAVAVLVRAVVERNTAARTPSKHVAVAVGAGVPAAGDPLLANRSALLRLVDAERLSEEEIAAKLRTQGLDHAGGSGAPGGALSRVAMRTLAPRLGSTLLVSHLGRVDAPEVDQLCFFPVTAGGTGVSAGLVTHEGRTSLTLRARARQWDERALGGLLDHAISLAGREV